MVDFRVYISLSLGYDYPNWKFQPVHLISDTQGTMLCAVYDRKTVKSYDLESTFKDLRF